MKRDQVSQATPAEANSETATGTAPTSDLSADVKGKCPDDADDTPQSFWPSECLKPGADHGFIRPI